MLRKPKGRVRNVSSKADRTYNGRVYHSKAEAKYAFELDYQVKQGKILCWIPQPAFLILWPTSRKPICHVILDFEIRDLGGFPRYVEIKGWETPEWRLKKKLLFACYPDIKLEVIRA